MSKLSGLKKAQARLDARIEGYKNALKNSLGSSAYKKPGSMNLKKGR